MRVVLFALFMVLATHVSAQEAKGVAKESPAVEKEQAKPADRGVPDAGSHGLPVTIVETPEQAANAAKREKQSDEHEAADLDAQRRAADAAERSAATAERQEIPAWTQIWLAIAGTIIAILAFFVSAWTSIQGLITTRAQLRAYVFVNDAFIKNLDGPGPAIVHVYLKNYGQTPAFDVTVAGAVKLATFPSAEFSRNPNGDQRVLTTTIPPNGDMAHGVDLPTTITPEIKAALIAGQLAIYAFGDISYLDAFKRRHRSSFRYMFGGDIGTRMFDRDGVRLAAMGKTIEGNSGDNVG